MTVTSTTMTMPETRSAIGLDRAGFALLLGFAASLQVSIAAAHILLTAMLVCWAATLVRDRQRPAAPPFFLPLVAYGGMTLLASAFSIDPMASLWDSRQLVLFLIAPAVCTLARRERAALVVDVIVSVGAASAAYGIIQYGILHYDHLGQRPEGWLSHYMTYSGVLMLVICAAVSRLLFGSRDRIWPALVMPALVVALALTSSRGPWVGACAAVGLLFLLKDFRLIALLPVTVAVLFAVAPDVVTNRMVSMFDMQDPTIRDRIAMAKTGAAIIADHPLTGIGPDMVEQVYVRYRDPGFVQPVNPHLHNVPLQIAAERGLPALAVWIWFVVVLVRRLWREFQSTREGGLVPPKLRSSEGGSRKAIAACALAATTAMLAAGLFEYNFGDSEFLMLFLVLATLPFAAGSDPGTPHVRHDAFPAPPHR